MIGWNILPAALGNQMQVLQTHLNILAAVTMSLMQVIRITEATPALSFPLKILALIPVKNHSNE